MMIFTTTRITNHNCHTDILSQWLRHSSSNIKVRLHLKSKKNKLYKNFYTHAKLHHFINDIYNQFSNTHHQIKKNNVFKPSMYSKKLLQTSIKKKNRTQHSLETNLINSQTIDQTSSIPTNINRIINTSDSNNKKNRTRIRRNFLRENNFNDEYDANVYDNDDRIYFRNRQEDIAEQKPSFDGEYYLPVSTKFKMRDNNGLYEDEIDQIDHAHNEEERNANKRFMQNDEKLINPDRLSNDVNLDLNDNNYRQYFKNNHNRKKFYEKNFNDYNYKLDRQRNNSERKYLKNDYLDKQDQLENEE
ncbi:unnamed protein product [Rotaria sordida]|uniref:Uncharacterized protein n=1 Tax=Rotaria sordida TaxID=392033 RepID=A0A818LSU9_9BILA|nr:unnamed protein product [Rotaria sordida]